MSHPNSNTADDCNGCELSRRAFLRDAGIAAAAALALVSAPKRLFAEPLRMIAASGRNDSTRSYPIPAADSVSIDKDNEVILVRSQGAMYAFALSCPHQNTALRWEEGSHQFQCPKHHSKYRTDGTFIEGRATRSMDRFDITKSGSNIVVNLDKLYQQDDNQKEWTGAVVNV